VRSLRSGAKRTFVRPAAASEGADNRAPASEQPRNHRGTKRSPAYDFRFLFAVYMWITFLLSGWPNGIKGQDSPGEAAENGAL
jgi:hypothetical protein